MRKLIFGINLTMDGCCDHTKGVPDGEIHAYFTQLMNEAGVLLYGRKTYELMVPFWPDIAKDPAAPDDSTTEFAKAFDAVEQIVVFSRTLDKVAHAKTRIVSSGLQEEVLKLKQEEGKDILLGGVDLPSQLMALDLIDEYRFVVQPVIVGEGRRLFDGVSLPEMLRFKLVSTKVFQSGCIALHYVK